MRWVDGAILATACSALAAGLHTQLCDFEMKVTRQLQRQLRQEAGLDAAHFLVTVANRRVDKVEAPEGGGSGCPQDSAESRPWGR